LSPGRASEILLVFVKFATITKFGKVWKAQRSGISLLRVRDLLRAYKDIPRGIYPNLCAATFLWNFLKEEVQREKKCPYTLNRFLLFGQLGIKKLRGFHLDTTC
jgi:hypothetical protein